MELHLIERRERERERVITMTSGTCYRLKSSCIGLFAYCVGLFSYCVGLFSNFMGLLWIERERERTRVWMYTERDTHIACRKRHTYTHTHTHTHIHMRERDAWPSSPSFASQTTLHSVQDFAIPKPSLHPMHSVQGILYRILSHIL